MSDDRRLTTPWTTLLDGLLVGGVPVTVVAVYFLPSSAKWALVLNYLDPTVLTLYTAHFVHFEPTHLATNALGFLLAASTGYALATAAGERRRFRVALTVIVVVLPPVLSLLNVAWPRRGVGYGASGVVMGVAGLLPLLLFGYFDGVTDIDATVADAPMLFFAGLAVASVAAPVGRIGYVVAGVAIVGSVAYGRDTGVRLDVIRSLPPGHPELLAVGAVIAVGYPLAAFPQDPWLRTGVINLYLHLLGYALGFIPAYLTPGVGIQWLLPGRLTPAER